MKRLRLLGLALASLFSVTTAYAASNHAQATVGIIIPMKVEATYICQQYFNGCTTPSAKAGPVLFYRPAKKFSDHSVVLARSGVGLENMSIVASAMINRYHPKLLISYGSAGGLLSNVMGDIVLGSDVFDAEFGTYGPTDKRPSYPKGNKSDLINPNTGEKFPLEMGFGHQKNPRIKAAAKATVAYFKAHPLTPHQGQSTQPTVKIGTIVDSTVFYTPSTMTVHLKKAGADAIAFEDIAFLHTCWFYNANCIAIRGVSNSLPVSPGNPADAAIYAGQNAAIVTKIFLQNYFK